MSVNGFNINGQIHKINYNNQTNIPSINGVKLIGNKTTEDLHISTDAELAGQVETLRNKVELMNGQKIDGAYIEDGYLNLTAGGEVVVGHIGPFAGGGGTGSGSNNGATLTVSNTTGWLSKTISAGNDCPISLTWSSLEENLPTGNGVMKLTVNNVPRATFDIAQGAVTKELKNYLSSGANAVRVVISDVYGNSRTINFSIEVKEISIRSDFDSTAFYQEEIIFPFTPIGNVYKTVHIKVDGVELPTMETSSSGRRLEYIIPEQPHGSHTLEAWFTCEVNGSEVESNRLFYSFMSVVPGNTTPIISSDFNMQSVDNYSSVTIKYIVYDPDRANSQVKLYADGAVVSTQTVDRTMQTWTYKVAVNTNNVNTVTLKIESGMATKEWTLAINESEVNIEIEQNNLELALSSYGRSNNEAHPEVWESGNISASLANFNFASDGWQYDKDNITVLRVSGDARVTIPFYPFATDARATGKTIELEFATRDVMDYDAIIMSCMSDGIGFKLTSQIAQLFSEQKTIFTQYKEEEHCRISFVIERRNQNKLIYCYINGIMSGAVLYPDTDNFEQATPVGISIGSNDAVIDIYNIRIYNTSLTRHQILNNWIADTQTSGEMIDRYERNNIFNEYDKIVISKLPSDLPYLILETSVLPQFKGDKKTIVGSYSDPKNPSNSFTFTGAEIDVQGTSSAEYPRKNYKIKFKGGFDTESGHKDKYAMRSDSIPTSTFTFKADVASSEGANNVELVRLYNKVNPYKTKPQRTNSDIRQGIDGFPIVIFHNDGNETKFLGKYNFNNDKGTSEVYGFNTGDESWEILNNTSNRTLFKSADFTSKTDGTFAWLKDFEGRYPDGNEDGENLRELIEWVSSTDQEKATNEPLNPVFIYEDVTYTHDTAEYRLAKFKEGFDTYFEKEPIIFYYLFTELFLMVDSRAKNAFPTFMQDSKWFMLPYDFDTALGINNEGTLTFGYELEDIDVNEKGEDIFNGQKSVLWVNLRAAYYDDIKAMYQNLRKNEALGFDYESIEREFEEHQSKWPEAVFNEDSQFKYIDPLVEQGAEAYLGMLQGSKKEQRRWWLYNRFQYMDSKYTAGDSLKNVITLRAYAKDNITITPYANIYASIKFGSYFLQQRASRNEPYLFECPIDNVNDTEIYIYSASQLKDIGDISGLKVRLADFSKAIKLQNLKVGDSSPTYSNGSLEELYVGNNTLLRTVDARNCPNLTTPVDLSGCTNIEHIYFDGTSITGLILPNGGIIKTIKVPSTLANLTIQNQKNIETFEIPSYENLTTVRLENVNEDFDMLSILSEVKNGCRIRMVGFRWEFDNVQDIFDLYDSLDAKNLKGLDENGNNTDKPQLIGTIVIDSLTGADYAQMREKYPYIEVEYKNLVSYLSYYNYDGSVLLQKVSIINGADGDNTYTGAIPTKASTAQYQYTFAGWSKDIGGVANPNALKQIEADRSVYAAFTNTVRKYTVRFYNGNTLLQTSQVAYGSNAQYTGTTPVYSGTDTEDYGAFTRWVPSNMTITGATDFVAEFEYTGSLVKNYLEKTLESFEDNEITTIRDMAFYGNKKIKSVSSTSALSVGYNAFDTGSTSGNYLEDVYLPNVTSIGESAFSYQKMTGNVNLQSVNRVNNYAFRGTTFYPNNLVLPSATYIGNNAFEASTCRVIDLPSATSIGSAAFRYTYSQLCILLRNTEQVCTYNTSTSSYDPNTGVRIYVPRALLDSYKTATNWSRLADKFVALEDHTVDGTTTGEFIP